MSELSIDIMNASREAAITARAETLKEIIAICENDMCDNNLSWSARNLSEDMYNVLQKKLKELSL